MKPKSNRPESTRAVPEELRLNFLFWNEEFRNDLEELKRIGAPGSREYDKRRAEIESDYELPYFPDSLSVNDPDLPPVCSPVRIILQNILDAIKDPRKGFFCRDCSHEFTKLVKTGSGYYCYNCGRMVRKVKKPAGFFCLKCDHQVVRTQKGKWRVAGGEAACPKCGSKRTRLQERFFEKPVEVKENVLRVDIDTRYSSGRILDELGARLSALEKLGQIKPNKARKRSDKYNDYLTCYDLHRRGLSLGEIANRVYPEKWPELPGISSDVDVVSLDEPTPKEIEERAKKYQEESRYANSYSYIQAKEDLKEEKFKQIKLEGAGLRRDIPDRLRIRKGLRQRVWRNIQEAQRLIKAVGSKSHPKI